MDESVDPSVLFRRVGEEKEKRKHPNTPPARLSQMTPGIQMCCVGQTPPVAPALPHSTTSSFFNLRTECGGGGAHTPAIACIAILVWGLWLDRGLKRGEHLQLRGPVSPLSSLLLTNNSTMHRLPSNAILVCCDASLGPWDVRLCLDPRTSSQVPGRSIHPALQSASMAARLSALSPSEIDSPRPLATTNNDSD